LCQYSRTFPRRQDVSPCSVSVRKEHTELSMGRYHFWIYDKDEQGLPLDEIIVRTAEEIHPTLIQYRQKEIDCDSTVNTILQSAVEATSKASRTNKIRNPRAYLVSVYHRLVDNLLDQRQHYMPTEDAV